MYSRLESAGLDPDMNCTIDSQFCRPLRGPTRSPSFFCTSSLSAMPSWSSMASRARVPVGSRNLSCNTSSTGP